MKLAITRLDPNLPLPTYHTRGAAAFDLYARQKVRVPAGGVARIPTNVIIQIPRGYVLTLAPRSSLAAKKSLLFPNGFGIIDSDYGGPKDEIEISVYNFSQRAVTVKRGERLAQALVIKYARVAWRETKRTKRQSRGGFGSTG